MTASVGASAVASPSGVALAARGARLRGWRRASGSGASVFAGNRRATPSGGMLGRAVVVVGSPTCRPRAARGAAASAARASRDASPPRRATRSASPARRDVRASAVTDPRRSSGVDDDETRPPTARGADRDAARGEPRRRSRGFRSASPRGRRGDDTEIRVRAAKYGRERAREKRGRGDGAPRGRGRGRSRDPVQGSSSRSRGPPSPEDDAARAISRAFDAALSRGHLETCVDTIVDALAAADATRRPAARERPDAPPSRDGGWVGRRDEDDDDPPSARVARALARRAAHKEFFAACAAARPPRVDLALRYAECLPADARMYSSLLGACARARDLATATRAFRLYARNNLPADAYAYSGLISAAGKCGKLETAAEALRDAVDAGACDDGVFNAFVDACARRGDYARAAETVATMRARGVSPNVRTYNSLITAAARANDLPAAKAALAALESDPRGLEATDRTYGAALSAAANGAPAAENVRWALETYERALSAGMGANNHAASSLLTALARGVGAGAWPAEDAVRRSGAIVDALVSVGAPNAAVWSAHLSVCARAGRAREALDALARMSSRGVPLEPYTLASVLTACRGGGGGFAAAADDEGEYLALSAEAWEALELFERAPPSASETTAVRNAAIALYAAVGRTDRAFSLYETMKAVADADADDEPGARLARAPDTITYNTLIAACASSPRPARAAELHEDMLAAGVSRSARTYVSLMTSAARAAPAGEGPDAALAWFAEHEADPTVGPPNAFAYTALIDAQAKGGAPEDAFETFERMKRAGVAPTVVTFGCLLNACRLADFVDGGGGERAVERAYALFGEMNEAGVCPNDKCQNALVRVVSEAGRVDDMLDEVKQFARRGGRFERATLEGVVRALCRAAYAERALRILSWMDARGYAPRAPTHRELVRVCSAEGQVNWAWTLHQRMRRMGHRPDRATCSALVHALCNAAMAMDSEEARGMLRRAANVFERASADGVADEGEGEANAWDDEEEDFGGGVGEVDDAGAGVATGTVVSSPGGSFFGSVDWSAEESWDAHDDQPAALGPACPVRGEPAAAAAARARRPRVPPNEVLTPSALRSLISAAARCGETSLALRLYRSDAGRAASTPARRSDGSVADDGGARAAVFEALIEACCHEGDVDTALEVFDDLKTVDVAVGKVTLAFLESVCRRSKTPDWRVYDVCAQMRKQVAAKKERRLAEGIPAKTSSHHVWGAVERGGADAEESTGNAEDTAAAVGPGPGPGLGSGGGDRAGGRGGGGGGMRERSRDAATEEAWERTRRERTRDRSGATTGSGVIGGGGSRSPDLAWLRAPDGDDDDDGGRDWNDERARGGAVGARASRAAADDLLQAELRSEGLGRGRAKRE